MQFVFFGALFLTYFLTQARHLFGGDSAEFSLVAQTWSIPHPPGYALYSVILNTVRIFFGFLPHYVSVNLPSIVFTVFSAIFIVAILKHLKTSAFAAYATAFLYGFTSVIWLYALVPEVYAFTSFFITGTTLFVLRLEKKVTSQRAFLVPLFITLGFFHHLSIVLFVPGWLFLLRKRLRVVISKQALWVILAIILGLLPLLYFPIASYFRPPLDWENAQTLTGFIRLITRASYGSFQAYVSSVPNFLNQYVQLLSAGVMLLQLMKPLGIFMILWGFRFSYQKRRNYFLFLSISLTLYISYLFMTNFSLETPFIVGIFERYLIGLITLLAIPLGLGIDSLGNSVHIVIARLSEKSTVRFLGQFAYFLLIGLFVIIQIGTSFSSLSFMSANRRFDDFGEDLLVTPPRNAIMSVKGDISYFTTTYLSVVKNKRRDLAYVFTDLMDREYYRNRVKTQYPSIVFGNKTNFNLEKFLNNNAVRGIYFEKPKNIGYWVPYGLLWKYYPDHSSLEKDMDLLIKNNNRLWDNVYRIPRMKPQERKIYFNDALNDLYLNPLHSYTQFLYTYKKYDLSMHYTLIILDYDPYFEPAVTTYAKLRAATGTCSNAVKDLQERNPAMKNQRQQDFLRLTIGNYCATSSRGT